MHDEGAPKNLNLTEAIEKNFSDIVDANSNMFVKETFLCDSFLAVGKGAGKKSVKNMVFYQTGEGGRGGRGGSRRVVKKPNLYFGKGMFSVSM